MSLLFSHYTQDQGFQCPESQLIQSPAPSPKRQRQGTGGSRLGYTASWVEAGEQNKTVNNPWLQLSVSSCSLVEETSPRNQTFATKLDSGTVHMFVTYRPVMTAGPQTDPSPDPLLPTRALHGPGTSLSDYKASNKSGCRWAHFNSLGRWHPRRVV